jgi:hypothetical protein
MAKCLRKRTPIGASKLKRVSRLWRLDVLLAFFLQFLLEQVLYQGFQHAL